MEAASLLTVAKEAALSAGEYLTKDSSGRVVNKEFHHDLKIEADIRSERIIIDFLKTRTPYSILSEERGQIPGEDQSCQWIIDPVDGSVNYLRGIPFCCVSIGLWRGEAPVLGIIYDFYRGEIFSGIINEGAWLNDQPIGVSETEVKEKAILCSGFPGNTDYSPEGIRTLIGQIQSYRKVRLLGAAALGIAYVACGRVDAYYEQDIMHWDIAAGVPIVLAAGGEIHMRKSSRPNGYHFWASNKKIVCRDNEYTASTQDYEWRKAV